MKKVKLFYIQHGYVGNAICWWRKGGHGYSTNLSEAGKWPEIEAKKQAAMRPGEDTAWPCDYINGNKEARKVVIDSQYCDFSKMFFRKRRPYKPRVTNNSHQIL